MEENKPFKMRVIADYRVTVPKKFRLKHGIEVGDILLGKEVGDSLIIRKIKTNSEGLNDG